MTRANAFGETFEVGDRVELRPDHEHPLEDSGEVVGVGEYGPHHVTVAWRGPTGDTAHIDRITHEEPMT
jgi:hypothetical protein